MSSNDTVIAIGANSSDEGLRQHGSADAGSTQAATLLRLVSRVADAREPATFPSTPASVDVVMMHLERALAAALERPAGVSPEFVSHLFSAMVAHLAHRHGGDATAAAARRGGLSERQERRATEYLASHFSETVSLGDLAKLCGLSRGHFARAFRHTTGVTPHRWLQNYRIARAREMLQSSRYTIAEIAIRCGFADQSHLTRVFKTLTGMSPAAWQRRNATD